MQFVQLQPEVAAAVHPPRLNQSSHRPRPHAHRLVRALAAAVSMATPAVAVVHPPKFPPDQPQRNREPAPPLAVHCLVSSVQYSHPQDVLMLSLQFEVLHPVDPPNNPLCHRPPLLPRRPSNIRRSNDIAWSPAAARHRPMPPQWWSLRWNVSERVVPPSSSSLTPTSSHEIVDPSRTFVR